MSVVPAIGKLTDAECKRKPLSSINAIYLDYYTCVYVLNFDTVPHRYAQILC